MKISFTPSLVGQRQLTRTSQAIQRSLERLSTGTTVNRPADNVAVSSQGVKLDAQIRGLRQGTQNVNQAQALLSTVEGAIGIQLELVTRMRELSLQAANGSLTSSDRSSINLEIRQLFAEFQRITNTTEFNGQKLLNGSLGKLELQEDDKNHSGLESIYLDLANLDASKVFLKTVGNGSFKDAVTYATATTGRGITSGDLNGDGILDLVDSESSTLTVFLGNRDGTFNTGRTLTAGTTNYSPQLADFNGDQVLDIVSADSSSGAVSIFIGNGDGTFSAQTTKAVGTTPVRVATGDFNRDGKIDIMSTDDSVTGTVSVLLGNGDGTFASATTTSTVTMAYGLDVADYNNDGILDFAVGSDTAGSLEVHLGVGNGTFGTASTYTVGLGTQNIVSGDINGDGYIDIVASNRDSGSASVLLGSATGVFSAGTTVTTQALEPNGIKLVDMNDDGRLDLLVDATSTPLELYFGNGNGTFQTGISEYMGSDVVAITTGDFNSDGVTDVAGINNGFNTISVLIADPIQTFAAKNIDVSTQANAQALLAILDTAASGLSQELARVGGLHERLDSTASANLLWSESLSEAKENMMGTDLAIETAELVRYQILQQAQVAVIAQANLNASVALGLLKFNG